MDKLVEQALTSFREAARALPLPPAHIRLWDGQVIELVAGATPRFTIVVNHPAALPAMFASPDFQSLGECYLRNDFDIEGDVEAIFPFGELIERLFADPQQSPAQPLPTAFSPAAGSQPHERERDAEAIKYHYDLSNRVYGLITDPTRMYSAAYFHSETDSLEQAQKNKLDRVCRKLDLRADEALLDIGCGWGGMILHAVRHHGVRALGITISAQQEHLAVERIRAEGFSERAAVRRVDYRDLDADRSYDKIVSLGMVEHVGVEQLPVYFEKAFHVLKDGGLFLMQGVTSNPKLADTRASPFAARYVFPDADMPYLVQYLKAAEGAGFEVRDVENLREQYALTHRHWRLSLERHREEIEAEIGMERYRALRLLYAYSTHYFFNHLTAVYQVLLHKPAAGGGLALPLRRPL